MASGPLPYFLLSVRVQRKLALVCKWTRLYLSSASPPSCMFQGRSLFCVRRLLDHEDGRENALHFVCSKHLLCVETCSRMYFFVIFSLRCQVFFVVFTIVHHTPYARLIEVSCFIFEERLCVDFCNLCLVVVTGWRSLSNDCTAG